MNIRTRFAPSPTGFLHIGSLRTALLAYAFAKSQKGKFILRIEDTDLKRLVPGATQEIIKMLKTFGINWDEGPLRGGPYAPYIQSQRVKTGIYQKYAEKLIKKGKAYYCFCREEELSEIKKRQRRKKVILRDECRYLEPKKALARVKKGERAGIRLKVPDNQKVSYFDFVLKKKVAWETNHVDEVMLLKSNGYPTYHLGVVVDDALMKVTHVIRGRDWLPSTPAHLLLFKYLNLPLPQIGHLTDILDPEGGKLSKRKGSVNCEDFLKEGYLPEAILNFVMLLGWAPKDNRELFTLKEFVGCFLKGELQTANPVFNRRKMLWFNGIYIRKKSNEELLQLIKPWLPSGVRLDLIKKTIPLVKERLQKLSDFPDLIRFFHQEPEVDLKMVIQKGKTEKETREALKKTQSYLEKISQSDWEAEKLEKKTRALVKNLKNWSTGQLFMTIRIVLTGQTATPPLFEMIAVLGRKKTLKRLVKIV